MEKDTDTAGLRERLQQALGGAYALERELGGGGMARVFVAEETALGRRVVVKVLAPEFAQELSAERFAREIRLSARLQHPNIVPVLAAGAAGRVPYYTMPYVDGESLRARLERGRPALAEAVPLLRDVARALAYAHAHGVVHRDIKPENVLLSGDAVVVADFGVAKAVDAARSANAPDAGADAGRAATLTQLGMVVGTPAYMAPEQAAGDPAVDHRADLYAWGVVAYELLAGRHPFAERRTTHALIVAHLMEEPTPLGAARPEVPPALADLVTRCLAKDPAARPLAREVAELLGILPASGAGHGTPAPPLTPSIAILPFANLSADPENEYFSDGVSEEILSLLAQDRGLRVATRSSSFAFKGKSVDLRTMAQQLQVTNLLEGSVRRAGNRVRITAQLVNAADGADLWSERFDRELTDIFAVQDEIAAAITATLRRRLLDPTSASAASGATAPAESDRAARRARHPVGVEAYEEYLKGKYAINRRPHGLADAQAHFERALALEPAFAAAHAGLGESFLWLGIFAVPPSAAFVRVRRHAERALALEPDLADGHYLLAEAAYWHDWDADACERRIGRALDLEPHHAGALLTRALLANVRLRRDESLASAAAAVRVDPLGLGTRAWFLAMTYNAHAYDVLVAEATRLIAEQPSYGEGYRWRAMAHTMLGDLADARADLEMARELGSRHVWVDVLAATVAALDGRAEELRGRRDQLMRRSVSEWVPPIALGHLEQMLGDYDAAFTWYERAYQMRDVLMTVFHTDPAYRLTPPGRSDLFAEDPRWIDLVRRVGLAP